MVDGNYGYFRSIEYGKVPKWALLSATRAGQHCSLGVQDAGWRKVLQSGNMLYVAANSGREGNDEASAFFLYNWERGFVGLCIRESIGMS